MLYPELPVFGFLAAALVLVPLPRHIRARNIACIALISWLFLHCIISAVNIIIWAENANNSAPIWCDITTKFENGENIAFTAATLCICKHLEFISSRRVLMSDFLQVHRKWFELVMCFVLPCLWMFLFYCFQPARFLIVENFGCFPAVYSSLASTLVLLIPPLLFGILTLIYGSVALHHMIDHRTNITFITPYLMSRDAALSSSQYYRLMVMSVVLGIWGVVWISLAIHVCFMHGFSSLPSWHVIHEHPSTIIVVPATSLGRRGVSTMLMTWWAIPGASFLFFLLFGTSREVMSEYQKFWAWFKITVLRQIPPEIPEWRISVLGTSSSISYPSPIHISPTAACDDLKLESKLALSPTLSVPLSARILHGLRIA